MTDAPSASLLTGTRIGPFRLREVLGRSRLGTAFLAEENERARTVVLQVLERGDMPAAALARFRYQVEQLAALRHPAIAAIHECGFHGIGDGAGFREVPWVSMDYVAGARPLVEYADARRLDRAARLRLFVHVCDAIHYGHQKGAMHGTLESGVVLVDADGRPKVVGIGLARAFARRAAASVADDVLALGRLLGALLGGAAGEELPGDLGAILRATRAEVPGRRYASAHALATDVRAYLEHRPVSAHAPDLLYPARMFVRRHWFITGGLAALMGFLALVGLVAGWLAWQGYVHEKAARERAAELELELEHMDDAADVLEEARAAEAAGDAVRARELTARALEMLRTREGR